MTVHDAELVTKEYDPAAKDARPIADCILCKVQFFPDDDKPSAASDRRYCGRYCKGVCARIKKYLKKWFPETSPTLEDFIADPSKFQISGYKAPTIPPPREGGLVQTYQTKKTERELAQAQKVTKSAERANAEKDTAKLKLKTAELELSSKLAETEERTAIQETLSSLSVIPLSENKDFLSGKAAYLPEAEIAKIRAGVSVIVRNHLMIAELVLSGKHTWTPQQASLFSKLLNKVVPDVSASKAEAPPEGLRDNMSITELEDFIAKAKAIEHNPETSHAKTT